jgi:hypothetical protein
MQKRRQSSENDSDNLHRRRREAIRGKKKEGSEEMGTRRRTFGQDMARPAKRMEKTEQNVPPFINGKGRRCTNVLG